MLARLLRRWRERGQPRHNPALARDAERMALADLARARPPQRQALARRLVHLALLLAMLVVVGLVLWGTSDEVGWADLTAKPAGDLLRTIFRR